MRVSKFSLAIILVLTLLVSFTGGYFITQLATKNEEVKNDKTTAEAASILSTNDFINSKSQIVKRLTYNKNGASYLKEVNEKATSDVLGMDRVSAEKYYKQKGFNLIEFTSKRVIIAMDIDSWPPGCFVIKGNIDYIAVYEVDESGKLKLKENTDIKLDNLPEEDRMEVNKGKIFESIDDAYWLLEEYSS